MIIVESSTMLIFSMFFLDLMEDFPMLSIFIYPYYFFMGILPVIGFKILFDFFPKIFIQYMLQSIYKNRLSYSQLLVGLIIIGFIYIVFQFDTNIYYFLVGNKLYAAIMYLLSLAISPVILKLLGWDILKKLSSKYK